MPEYAGKFEILAFPCNQFGCVEVFCCSVGNINSHRQSMYVCRSVSDCDNIVVLCIGMSTPCRSCRCSHQEWPTEEEIPLSLKYVRPGNGFVPNFPLFSKIDVNGADTHPVFQYLRTYVCVWSQRPKSQLHWQLIFKIQSACLKVLFSFLLLLLLLLLSHDAPPHPHQILHQSKDGHIRQTCRRHLGAHLTVRPELELCQVFGRQKWCALLVGLSAHLCTSYLRVCCTHTHLCDACSLQLFVTTSAALFRF